MSSSLAYDWVITNGCFKPFGVSTYYGIAQGVLREEWHPHVEGGGRTILTKR